jgi:hypothetical protein
MRREKVGQCGQSLVGSALIQQCTGRFSVAWSLADKRYYVSLSFEIGTLRRPVGHRQEARGKS